MGKLSESELSLLQTPWGKLMYAREGNSGPVTLLIHGFGQNHEAMLPLGRNRPSNESYIYLDMFYHGRSIWSRKEVPLSKSIWAKIIQLLQVQEDFQNFHLIGFSMGGKLSLLTYEVMSDQVLSLQLIGPDGIQTGKWYSTSNYPDFVSPAFKRLVFKPQPVFRAFENLRSVGIIEKSIYKFITTQMETRSKRAQVFFVWKVFGRIQLDLGKIIRTARAKKTPIALFVGRYDAMVTARNLQRFSSKIPQAKMLVLPVGHGQLIEATVARLSESRL